MTGPGPRDQFDWYAARKGNHVRFGFRIVQVGVALIAVILMIIGFVVVR